MEIEKILALPKWTPLSAVVPSLNYGQLLGSSLFPIGSRCYLHLSVFKNANLEKRKDGPSIIGVLWACDEGAAKRAIYREIEADSGVVMDVPKEFLPYDDCGPTYGDILSAEKLNNTAVLQESGSYRISTDGRFIHRIIETESAAYFFRHAEHELSEKPYAVIKKLSAKTHHVRDKR